MSNQQILVKKSPSYKKLLGLQPDGGGGGAWGGGGGGIDICGIGGLPSNCCGGGGGCRQTGGGAPIPIGCGGGLCIAEAT